LHDSHIRMALRRGAHAICEKPLVLNPWNLDALQNMELESGKKVYNILQLREHQSIIDLKKRVDEAPKDKIFDIDLTYLTSRGNWYYTSWKGDKSKSGGIATNIGVHFYDMLSWIFGSVKENTVHIQTHDRSAGYLEFDRARVRWFLSINYDVLPDEIKAIGQTTYRSIKIEGEELEFSGGFKDLHTRVYEGILNGNGYGLDDARQAIEIVHNIRNSEPVGLKGEYHPLAKIALVEHPFMK
jgi:UDP-N-acetyl-2-amino-2-deoxyglucuronate dehydrogenase